MPQDEKRELVRRVLSAGGSRKRAAEQLQEYLEEKDARLSMNWCEWFVDKIAKEMKR